MRTAIVTGASKGIGRQIALELGRTHHVIAVGRNEDDLRSLLAEIPSGESLVIDLAEADLEQAFGELDTSELDFVVHAAAIGEEGRIDTLTREDWRRSFEINFLSIVELTRILIPAMRAGRGTFVFINSGSGRMSYIGGEPYTATKHALRDLADCLREEEREHGVRVTSLYPGWVLTELGRNMRSSRGEIGEEYYIPVESFRPIIRTLLEMPETASIEELILRPSKSEPTGS
ncbi:SDR family NAD(P)-dependent oxidoreductase [Leucobacter sp. GX24907]